MDSRITSKKPKLMESSEQGSSWSGSLSITAVSTKTGAEQALVSNDRHLFDKLFTNDIVWKTLGSYLNLDDLKDCRLTCQLLNTKIIDLKSFKDRARLNLPLSIFPASDLAKTRVHWKHLAINVDLNQVDTHTENLWDSSQHLLSILSQVLSSIISLKLYRTNYCSFSISAEVPETFSRIFLMMPNIQEISMDLKIFEKVDLSWFARASATLMSKVKEFRLECNYDSSIPDEVMRFSMSLPSDCLVLQVLCIDSFSWKWHNERGLDSVIDRLDPLFPILRQNQSHLRSFQINDFQLWAGLSAERLGPLPKFPQLKVLKLKIVTEEGVGFFSEAHLIQFLNNLPESLEEIDLEIMGSIPSSVFQILKDHAMGLNLKVLRIILSGRRRTTPSDIKMWNFFKETNVEEFSLHLPVWSVPLSNRHLKDFYGALPKHAKKLSIMGVRPVGEEDMFELEVSKCFNPKVLTQSVASQHGGTGVTVTLHKF